MRLGPPRINEPVCNRGDRLLPREVGSKGLPYKQGQNRLGPDSKQGQQGRRQRVAFGGGHSFAHSICGKPNDNRRENRNRK